MRLNIRSTINKILFVSFLCACAAFVQAQDLNLFGNSPYYDFSRTSLTLVLNKDGEGLAYWPPFTAEDLNMGVLLYTMLLKYSESFEKAEPLGDPDYHIVIIGPGQIRNYYLGLGWLEFEDSIALLSDEDYEELLYLIQIRFKADDPADKPIKKAGVEGIIRERLKQQQQSNLSVAESIAEARRKIKPLFDMNQDERWDNFEPEVIDIKPPENSLLQERALRSQKTPDDKPDNSQSRSSRSTLKHARAEMRLENKVQEESDNSGQPPLASQKPDPDLPVENTGDEQPSEVKAEKNSWFWLSIFFVLILLLGFYSRIRN